MQRTLSYKDLTDGIDMVMSLSRVATAPSIVYFYAIDVDYAAHEYGTNATQTIHALDSVDKAVERLAMHMPSKTRLILTADHGHLDGPTHEILPTDPLVGHLLHEPWGDAREMHFAVKPGSEEEFQVEFRRQVRRVRLSVYF